MASGAVTANVIVLKTIITVSGSNAYTVVSGAAGQLNNVMLVGSTTSNYCGIIVGGAGMLTISQVGVTNFQYGMYATGSTITVPGSSSAVNAVSGCFYGFFAVSGGILSVPNAVSIGSVEGYESEQARLFADNSYAGGNSDVGYRAVVLGQIRAEGSRSEYNTNHGYGAWDGAALDIANSNASSNPGFGIIASRHSFINASGSSGSGNGTGIFAELLSLVDLLNGSNNSYNPPLNTQGNNYGYIMH